jgi:hypothetical protein
MSDELKHGNAAGNGGYERQDLQPSSILYFLLAIGVGTLLCVFLLRGLFGFLDRREKSLQPAVNPLVTNVPEDTRHVAPKYPATAFPNPRLEEDERGQLNGILAAQQKMLYSYGWVDEKAGTIHIPIERAMDLIVERGLPIKPQNASGNAPSGKAAAGLQTAGGKFGKGTASSVPVRHTESGRL